MGESFTISPSEFVVQLPSGPAREEFQANLAELGSVELLPAAPDYVILRLNDPGENPRQAWESLREHLRMAAKDVMVSPVLVDTNGEMRYPLGTITIRFKETLSDQELKEFCQPHGLKVAKRNQYIPSQVSFQPNDARAFLPDVLDHVLGGGEYISVWPETLSAYRREG